LGVALACVLLLTLTGCTPGPETVVAADTVPAQGDAGATVDERLTEAQSEFGLDLLSEVMAEENAEGRNVTISPLSVATALSITWNGTASQTAEEFASVLQLADVPLEDVNAAYADLLARVADAEDVELTVANSLWADADFEFREEFVDTNREYYGAGLYTVDFDDTEAAADAIGAWLSDRTNGLIEETPAGVNPDDVMHLINALYFLGEWEWTFDPDYTGERSFTLSDGTQIEVESLAGERTAEVMLSDEVAIARVPYRGDAQAAYILLPPEGTSLADFAGDVEMEDVDRWIDDLEEVELTFQMPKLETSYEASLKEPLERLGMTTAFSGGDFSPMTDDTDLMIRDVGHATYLRVDEEGTEAAAVTDVTVGETAVMPPPDEFIVDRPYLFLLRDDETGALIIAAAIEDPRS
jgi:serpin B